MDVVVAALLAAGATAQLVCVVGTALMEGPFDRLHYAGAGATLGPLLIGTAAFVPQGLSAGGLLVVVAVLLLVGLAPATTMALARSARRADRGSVSPRPPEVVEEEEEEEEEEA